MGAPGVDATSALRGRRIGYVPQDPFRALDPLRRVGPQVRRPLQVHLGVAETEADARVRDLLTRLGVPEPERVMGAYPHELSGGMLQRATIAGALACGPELVIADEPTTALDALVQVQVIDAFLGLVRDLGTAVLVITHDLRLLARAADRAAAMYAGKIVEFGGREAVLERPRHPYPAALRAASVLRQDAGRPRAHDRRAAADAAGRLPALCVRPALPARDGGVPHGGAAVRLAGGGRVRVPPPAGGGACVDPREVADRRGVAPAAGERRAVSMVEAGTSVGRSAGRFRVGGGRRTLWIGLAILAGSRCSRSWRRC